VLTSHCNIGCFYCHNEGQPKGVDFLAPDLFNHVLNLARTSDDVPKVVAFTGGEPLLNPYLESYAAQLRPLTGRIAVVTNGILLDGSRIESLLRSGITSVRVGLDSVRRNKSRPTATGKPETRQVLGAIDLLIRCGVSPSLNVVLTNFNKNEVPSLLSFCAERQLSAKFFEQVVPSVAGFGPPQLAPSEPTVEFSRFDEIVKSILNVDGNDCAMLGAANTVYSLPTFEIRYCRFLCRFGLCFATGTRIDPSGHVYTCMNATNRPRIQPGEGMHESRAAVRRALRESCGTHSLPVAHVPVKECQRVDARYT
jgi:MoaA/NifB/PqqE/SkfB family radical SAM enzyme